MEFYSIHYNIYCSPIIRLGTTNFQHFLQRNFASSSKKVPQPMVPGHHFTTRMWKKATNHFINMASLSNHLIHLMTIINEGLKKAALKISQQDSTSQKQELVVYTAVKGLPGYFDGIFKNDSFKASIWYIFVYNSATKQGVMIYVHSTLSSQIEKKCLEKNEIKCAFSAWSTSMDPMTVMMSIDLQYVYCCKVTSADTEEIFQKRFEIEKHLDIQALITQ